MDNQWPSVNSRPLFPEGVGKSTIITTLIKESFVPNVCAIVTLARGVCSSALLIGATRRAGSNHPTRSDTRECYNVHRGFFSYAFNAFRAACSPIPYPQRALNIATISKPKFARHMSSASCTPLTILIPSTALPLTGFHTFAP